MAPIAPRKRVSREPTGSTMGAQVVLVDGWVHQPAEAVRPHDAVPAGRPVGRYSGWALDANDGEAVVALGDVHVGGQPAADSKAKYTLDPGLAAKIAGRASELLASYPLYPAINLATGADTDPQKDPRRDATDG